MKKTQTTPPFRNIPLTDLATELKAESILKRDFLVPSSALSMRDGNIVIANAPTKTQMALNAIFKNSNIGSRVEDRSSIFLHPLDVCHEKIAQKLLIPNEYYKRMRASNPTLLDDTVTSWLHLQNINPKTQKRKERIYMARTFASRGDEQLGILRTLVSDRFSAIDNYDILMTVLDVIQQSKLKVNIDACDITDKKFYVRVTCPDIQLKAPALLQNYRKPGHHGKPNLGVISGFVISNSEIGYGGFSITPRAIILECWNGLTRSKDTFRKTHLGAKLEENNGIIWSAKTQNKNLELIQTQVNDAVSMFISKEYLGSVINELEQYSEKELEYPVETVKNVCASLNLSEEKENDILRYFTQSSDTSHFGVSQALTYYAHESTDVDEQFMIEGKALAILPKMKSYDRPSKAFKVSIDEDAYTEVETD